MDSFHDLCCLRSTLESFAAVRLRTHPERAQVLARLQRGLEALQVSARRGDYEGFHQADMALHRALVQSCAVPTLAAGWEAAAGALDEAILAVKKKHWPSLMALYREHVYLLEAWASPEASVIEQATHHHLEVGWYRLAVSSGRIPEEGNAVDRVASFLSTHHASEIELAWVARHIGFVSTGHLTRLFRAQLGLAPYAWLRQARLERAAQLLVTTDDDVAAIGRKVGYRNASHFTRDFRRKFGLAPRRYRAAQAALPRAAGDQRISNEVVAE